MKASVCGSCCLTNHPAPCLESATRLLQREQQRCTPPPCQGNHKLTRKAVCRVWGRLPFRWEFSALQDSLYLGVKPGGAVGSARCWKSSITPHLPVMVIGLPLSPLCTGHSAVAEWRHFRQHISCNIFIWKAREALCHPWDKSSTNHRVLKHTQETVYDPTLPKIKCPHSSGKKHSPVFLY